MNGQERNILISKYQYLLENIRADKLCPYLIQYRVIDLDDKSVILSKPDQTRQAEVLIDFLFRSPSPKTFELFLLSLKESGWEFVESELATAFSELRVTSNGRPNQSREFDAVDGNGVSSSNGNDDGCQCIDTGAETSMNDVTQPVSYFCRRISLETQLSQMLEEKGYAVLSGIRGAGKTQLARHFICNKTECNSKLVSTTNGVRMEIDSRNEENLHSGIEYMMQVLNINIENPAKTADKRIKNGLNTILGHLKKLKICCGCHFLLFDDVRKETYRFLTNQMLKMSLKQSDNVKILVTTNNINLYDLDCITVGGLEDKETLDLFKQGYESESKDEDIIELGKHLSYLPLGIAVAKQIVRKRQQTVSCYMRQLLSPSTSKKLQSREAQVFVEKEYDKGLMSALTISIGEIESSLDSGLFRLYELTALGSHVRFPLGTLKMLMNWADDEEKEFELDDLVEAIKETAVGTISREGEERYLDTHQAVMLAIRLNWKPKQLREYIGSFLLLMSKVCIKDTRFQDAFRVQATLLPHAEAVMKHSLSFDHTTCGLQVAKIKLLEAIGYMYAQMSMLERAQHYLLQARDIFAKYFLDNDLSLFLPDEINIEAPLNMKKNAQLILDRLELTTTQINADNFLEFVLERTHLPNDRKMWRALLKQKYSVPNTDDLFVTSSLSKEDYEILQKHNMALSESEIRKIFLPELLITTIFTLGRIYFFKNSKGNYVDAADGILLRSSLQLAHELCLLIHERYNVPLVHLMLTRHYGLMYLMMEKKGKSQVEHLEMLRQAKSNYQDVLKDSMNYFQGGLLKKVANEDYNVAVCLRQLVRCHVRLLRNDTPENWHQNKQDGSAYVQRLKVILSNNRDLFHLSGFNLNIAKYYAQIALQEKSPRDFDEAVELYRDCCDAECKSGYVKYPWLLALKGLGYLVLHFGINSRDHYAIPLAIRKTEEFLFMLKGHSTSYPFEWRKGCTLLGMLKKFEGSLTPGSFKSSTDFLNSPSRSFDELEFDGTDYSQYSSPDGKYFSI